MYTEELEGKEMAAYLRQNFYTLFGRYNLAKEEKLTPGRRYDWCVGICYVRYETDSIKVVVLMKNPIPISLIV